MRRRAGGRPEPSSSGSPSAVGRLGSSYLSRSQWRLIARGLYGLRLRLSASRRSLAQQSTRRSSQLRLAAADSLRPTCLVSSASWASTQRSQWLSSSRCGWSALRQKQWSPPVLFWQVALVQALFAFALVAHASAVAGTLAAYPLISGYGVPQTMLTLFAVRGGRCWSESRAAARDHRLDRVGESWVGCDCHSRRAGVRAGRKLLDAGPALSAMTSQGSASGRFRAVQTRNLFMADKPGERADAVGRAGQA